MMNKYKKDIVIYLATLGLVCLVTVFWQVLELVFYKEVQPRIVDNIIILPLMYSIYLNIKNWLSDWKYK